MYTKSIKLFLRLSIAVGFLSAVADRFGMLPAGISAWGNWDAFVTYTGQINPWFPESVIPVLAVIATCAEIILALFLIIGFKTKLMARLSGFSLLLFALFITFSIGLKPDLDYTVFSVSADAFDCLVEVKFWEVGSEVNRFQPFCWYC